MTVYLLYILSAIIGGMLTGMVGLTAAMVLTPILCGVCGWDGYDAVTLSLIANIPSALATFYTYQKHGNTDLKKGIPIALISFLGAIIGSILGFLFSRVSSGAVSYAVIASNLLMAVSFLFPPKEKKVETSSEKKTNSKNKHPLAMFLGLLIGILCGFMGSAGGAMMPMMLSLVLGMEMRIAVGTSSLVMTLVALSGAGSNLFMGAEIDWIPTILITVLCTISAVASSKFANKASEKVLNYSAATVLVFVSVFSLLVSF